MLIAKEILYVTASGSRARTQPPSTHEFRALEATIFCVVRRQTFMECISLSELALHPSDFIEPPIR